MSQDHTYPHLDCSPSDAGTHPPDPSAPWFWDSQQRSLELIMPGWYPQSNVYPQTNTFPPPNGPPAEVYHVQQSCRTMSDMSHSYSQESVPELSPLPLPEVQSTFSDIFAGPTSPVPGIALPSPPSTYHTPYTSITELSPHVSSDTFTSPSGSYLPVPSSFNSPYIQVSPMGSSTRVFSSPGEPYPPSYQNLYPGSPSSFYSLNSPALASTSSFHSIATQASPRVIPYFPPANWESSASISTQTAPSAQRQSVPQTIKLSPKRNRSHRECFSSRGSLGVRVADILKGDASLDGHDERVLERTGHRQIRVTIQWPGYPEKLSKDRYIAIQDKDTRTYITRGELARQICEYVAEYVKKAVRAPPPSKSQRAWTFTSVESSKPGITIDNLWLTSVAVANKNIWLIELEVLRY